MFFGFFGSCSCLKAVTLTCLYFKHLKLVTIKHKSVLKKQQQFFSVVLQHLSILYCAPTCVIQPLWAHYGMPFGVSSWAAWLYTSVKRGLTQITDLCELIKRLQNICRVFFIVFPSCFSSRALYRHFVSYYSNCSHMYKVLLFTQGEPQTLLTL